MNSVTSFAELGNLVVSKATGQQVEDAIISRDRPADRNQKISATGLIAEFGLTRVSKADPVKVHFVTEQGFRNLFTADDDQLSGQFISMLHNAVADDFDYVRTCLRDSVNDMPHNTKKEPNKATATEHSAYQAAMTRKSEFCTILGAIKFAGFSDYNGMGKIRALQKAREMLTAKGIDWRGELVALKDARREERINKAATKQAIEVATAAANAGKVDLSDIPTLIGELTKAVKDQSKAERAMKKLEGMQERAIKATEGLLKFYDNDVSLARKHIEAMLAALPAVEQQ